jgi:hypothetical protein
MDQLGIRSEVAVVSLVEVSDISRSVGDFTLTLKRDVPEVGRQGHALMRRRVQRYVNKKVEVVIFHVLKGLARWKIGSVGSPVFRGLQGISDCLVCGSRLACRWHWKERSAE